MPSALGNVIIAFAIGLVAFCILFVVQRTFYALGDTRTPFFFTLVPGRSSSRSVRSACLLLPVDWIAVGIALVDHDRRHRPAHPRRRCCCGGASDALDGAPHRPQPRSTYLAAVVLPVVAGVGLLVASAARPTADSPFGDRVGAIVSMVVIGVVMAAAYFGGLWLLALARAPRVRRSAARAASRRATAPEPASRHPSSRHGASVTHALRMAPE